jgi:AcrR family transcriptional regulator
MLYGTERFRSLDVKKRSVVLDAAANEFASFGYLAASTNRIASAAKISKGALFSYFPTKELLFGAVLSSMLDRVQADSPEMLTAPSNGTLEADLRALMARLFALHARWPKLLRLSHALTFEAPHLPAAQTYGERFRAWTDEHARTLIARQAAANQLVTSTEVATHLTLSALDHLRDLLVTGSPDVRDQNRYDVLCAGLSAAIVRAIQR